MMNPSNYTSYYGVITLLLSFLFVVVLQSKSVTSFVSPSISSVKSVATTTILSVASSINDEKVTDDDNNVVATSSLLDTMVQDEKLKLFGLIRARPYIDPVLADPITQDDIIITTNGLSSNSNSQYEIQSSTNKYSGSSNTYINLLEPITITSEEDTTTQLRSIATTLIKQVLVPLTPPPLRSIVSSASNSIFGANNNEYIPMRDLFTSPAVSYAYERGWRQGFVRAGFPGPDTEAELAMNYFEYSMNMYNTTRVLVDMSCATGIFTRRFVSSQKYKRVLGCDYSDSMLQQARQFITNENLINKSPNTNLDLIRLDVGQIPMKTMSIDSVHAGAAMHCWPDVQLGVSEIYRILKPGGRYFATTFLSSYFSLVRNTDGFSSNSDSAPQQAFQYFASKEDLIKIIVDSGFSEDKVSVEIIQPACVIIRCEK